jgi:hypothetical protein
VRLKESEMMEVERYCEDCGENTMQEKEEFGDCTVYRCTKCERTDTEL